MATGCLTGIANDLAMLFDAGGQAGRSDAELLARFVSGGGDIGAEAAFAAIVARHGPMVLGVCRRVLGDPHAAEDAFQATFFVLARKARTVRVDDSLGGWLHGVGARVALRARSLAASRRFRGLEGIDPPERKPIDRPELISAIDAEIARLPRLYREVMVLCHVEGLDQREVARRLRCPLGTVQSRLHRARSRLRSGLTRRGLAPSAVALATALKATSARASLARGFVKSVSRHACEATLGGTFSPVVGFLAHSMIRRIAMRQIGWIVAVMIGVGGLAVAAVSMGPLPRQGAPEVALTPSGPRKSPSLREQIEAVLAEWRRFDKALDRSNRSGLGAYAEQNLKTKYYDTFTEICRRLLDLSATNPGDLAARDALIFICSQPWVSIEPGLISGELVRAADLLLAYHGDDPKVARVALGMTSVMPWPGRDRLVFGLMETTRSHESKGLALLARAEYLGLKCGIASRVRKTEPPFTKDQWSRPDGGSPAAGSRPYFDPSYEKELRTCDLDAMHREMERLLEEVIRGYGDVPRSRLERESPPSQIWYRGISLAAEAAAWLDGLHGLKVGKTVPEIEGIDFAEKASRLADHRGKVVVVVCWRTGDNATARELAHDRALVDRMRGRPFVLIGVNGEHDKAVALRTLDEQGADWINLREASILAPDGRRSAIQSYPAVFVIDAKGTIQSRLGNTLLADALIETLVKQAEGK